MTTPDQNQNEIQKPERMNFPFDKILVCPSCGQAIEKAEHARQCKRCNLRYHAYCGFSTPDSEICNTCLYEQHAMLYAQQLEEDKKRGRMGCAYISATFVFVVCTVFYGFDYFGGNSSALVPFIILCILTIASIAMVVYSFPIIKED